MLDLLVDQLLMWELVDIDDPVTSASLSPSRRPGGPSRPPGRPDPGGPPKGPGPSGGAGTLRG